MEFAIGTVGTIGGIVVAVGLFALGWWFVARARAGNASVRRARRDPHLNMAQHQGDPEDPNRDIPQ